MMCCLLSFNSVSEAGTHAQTFLSVLKFGLASVFPEMHVNILLAVPSQNYNFIAGAMHPYKIPNFTTEGSWLQCSIQDKTCRYTNLALTIQVAIGNTKLSNVHVILHKTRLA